MTDIICSVYDFFKNIIVLHFPDLSIDSGTMGLISSSFTMIVEFIGKVNFIVPIPTILTIFGLVYGFKFGKFLLFVANWVIRRIADIIP